MKLNSLRAKKVPAFFRSQKFFSLFSSTFNSAIALITLGLLTRAMSRDDFGHWAFFLTVFGLYEMGLNGLIRTPVIRMAANEEDYRYNQVLASAWDILVKVCLIFGAVVSLGFLIAGKLAGDPSYLKIAYWFPLYCLLIIPQQIGVWNSNALMKFQRIILIRSTSVVVFLLGVIYVYYTGAGIETVFWLYLLAAASTSALVLMKGWASFKCYLKHKKAYRKDILNFGKYSMGTTLSATALTNSDSFLIIYFLGPEALALYEIPKRIRGMYHIPLRGILQLSYPHLSKKLGKLNPQQLTTEFQRIVGFTFMAMLPLPILIFIFSDWLVTLLGGEAYADSAIILKVFAVILLIAPFDRFSGLVLDVIGKPSRNMSKVLIMLTVNVLGDIIAIKLGYGVVGVATVTLFTLSAGIAYGFFIHRKELPFNLFSFVKQGGVQSKIILKEFRFSNR